MNLNQLPQVIIATGSARLYNIRQSAQPEVCTPTHLLVNFDHQPPHHLHTAFVGPSFTVILEGYGNEAVLSYIVSTSLVVR